jgi:hypothetical protein
MASIILPKPVPLVVPVKGPVLAPWSGGGKPIVAQFSFMGTLPANVTQTRASNGWYTDASDIIQQATSNVARFTYRGGVCRGLLNEPLRTNLFGYSARLDQMSQSHVTVVINEIAGPNGVVEAEGVQAIAEEHYHLIWQRILGVSDGVTTTGSIYLKKGTHCYAGVILGGNGNAYTVTIDLNTGLVEETNNSGGATKTDYTVENAGNGWWRLSVTNAAPDAATDLYFEPCMAVQAGTTVTWDPYSEPIWNANGTEKIYAWGGQVEIGSTPSSPIATPGNGSSVTRSADVTTISSAGIPNGTYDITIYREEGSTFLPAQVVTGGYVIPTSVSPLQKVIFQ